MGIRYYRNGQATALTAPVDSVSTSIDVDQASSFPTQFPYTLIVDPDGVLEEVVEVTAAVGTTLTVSRGVDGSTASAHSAGVTVYHGVSARDHQESNAHNNATSNVHGVTGGLVGTAGNQSIAGDKSFTGAVTVGGSPVMTLGAEQTVTGRKIFSDLETSAGGDVMALGGTQTVTGNKTYTGTETHQGSVALNGPVAVGGLALYPADHRVATGDIPTPLNGAWGNVTGFSFAAVAGAVYAIDAVMFLENPSASTVDVRFGYSFPAGRISAGMSGVDVNTDSPAYNGISTAHSVIAESTSPLDEVTGLGTPANIPVVARLYATFFCTTGGTVQLRFRQDTSSASYTTRVKDGSRMRIQRIS